MRLTTDQLLMGFALLAVLVWLVSFLDDSAEAEGIAQELDALPVLTRRDVRRVLSARRWR